jgi:hypothetical protein
MPKITKHPRLRTLVRRGSNGQRWVYYYYDMRPEGGKDVPLGKDYAVALAKWSDLHNKRPSTIGTLEEAFAQWERDVLPTYTSAVTRLGYTKGLKRLRPAFGAASWPGVKMKHLVGYLDKRKGKTQANRELSLLQIIWNYARIRGMTDSPWPAAGMARSRWKNPEKAREIEVTDAMFEAIREHGDQVLKDAMDLASATGMRLTDVRTIALPPGDTLHLRANKTGKKTDFDLRLSSVLPELIARRRKNRAAEHVMLLAGPFKRSISERMLTDRFAAARQKAASQARSDGLVELADAIAVMVMRDCRGYASDLANTVEEAQRLLQHGSPVTTVKHYRSRADMGKPVR